MQTLKADLFVSVDGVGSGEDRLLTLVTWGPNGKSGLRSRSIGARSCAFA